MRQIAQLSTASHVAARSARRLRRPTFARSNVATITLIQAGAPTAARIHGPEVWTAVYEWNTHCGSLLLHWSCAVNASTTGTRPHRNANPMSHFHLGVRARNVRAKTTTRIAALVKIAFKWP